MPSTSVVVQGARGDRAAPIKPASVSGGHPLDTNEEVTGEQAKQEVQAI